MGHSSSAEEIQNGLCSCSKRGGSDGGNGAPASFPCDLKNIGSLFRLARKSITALHCPLAQGCKEAVELGVKRAGELK